MSALLEFPARYTTSTGNQGQTMDQPTNDEQGACYTQLPNYLLDCLMPVISTVSELKVTFAIARKTLGWHKAEDELSLSQLEKLTGLHREDVSRGIKSALQRGSIKRRPARRGSYFYRLVSEVELLQVVGKTDHLEVVGISDQSVKPTSKNHSNQSVKPTRTSRKFRPELVGKTDPQKKDLNKRNKYKECTETTSVSEQHTPPASELDEFDLVLAQVTNQDNPQEQTDSAPSLPTSEPATVLTNPDPNSPVESKKSVGRGRGDKPPKTKAAKSPDPLLQHPANQAYRKVCRFWPNEEQRRQIAETVGESPGQVERWQALLKDWMLQGWRPTSVGKMLDKFVKEVKQDDGSTGSEQQQQRGTHLATDAAAKQLGQWRVAGTGPGPAASRYPASNSKAAYNARRPERPSVAYLLED